MVYPNGAPPRTRTVHPVRVYYLKVYLSSFFLPFSETNARDAAVAASPARLPCGHLAQSLDAQQRRFDLGAAGTRVGLAGTAKNRPAVIPSGSEYAVVRRGPWFSDRSK